jgi:hypothetical protein
MRGSLPTDADQPIQVELEGMALIGLCDPVVLEISSEQCRLRSRCDQDPANGT